MLGPSAGEKCGLGACPTENFHPNQLRSVVIPDPRCGKKVGDFRSVGQTPRAVSLRSLARWSCWIAVVLATILVPFYLYEEPISAWSREFLVREDSRWLAGGVLGALLAADLVSPVPSSVLSTAAGYLLGLWTGSFVTWAGMTAGCLIGYGLGATAGRKLTSRFVGDDELERASLARGRFGDWMIVICRAVPVLAEASVLFAGVTRMPFRKFVLLAALSNLGIAVTYSAVGAYALEAESFLLAFAGAIILPGVAMLLARLRN